MFFKKKNKKIEQAVNPFSDQKEVVEPINDKDVNDSNGSIINIESDNLKKDYRSMSVDELIKDVDVEEYCPKCGSKIEEESSVCTVCKINLE